MIFSVANILLTAAITSASALIVALWRLRLTAWPDILGYHRAVRGRGVVVRLSANMPALNDDGLPGFSANDWAAPGLTLFLTCSPICGSPPIPTTTATRALADLAVDVITI